MFKYNGNAKHSTKDLKGGCNSNNCLVLDVYLNEKGPSVKISTWKFLRIIILYQYQILEQDLMMNSRYLLPFG